MGVRGTVRGAVLLACCISLKRDNLWAAMALHFAAYNFTWMHSSIRMTPAMKAGLPGSPGLCRTC
jgi:hypothetical protein